jgi:hypothetical protein
MTITTELKPEHYFEPGELADSTQSVAPAPVERPSDCVSDGSKQGSAPRKGKRLWPFFIGMPLLVVAVSVPLYVTARNEIKAKTFASVEAAMGLTPAPDVTEQPAKVEYSAAIEPAPRYALAAAIWASAQARARYGSSQPLVEGPWTTLGANLCEAVEKEKVSPEYLVNTFTELEFSDPYSSAIALMNACEKYAAW